MLSYKQWKTVNESVMPGGGCLGVSTPNSLGIMSKFGLVEAAKKSKKKMFGDEEDETGDGEVVDAASEKDEPEIDIDDAGDEEHDGGCNMCGKNSKKKSAKKSAKKSLKKSKKKMWGDEDDAAGGDEVEGEDMGGDDEGDEDLEAAEEESGEDLDGDDEEGEGEDHIAKMKSAKGKAHMDLAMGGGDEEAPMFSKKKSAKKSEKKSEKKMQKENIEPEDADWWNSVKTMMGSNPDQKFDDGWTQYHDPLDPLPGEVGFAPQGRIGS